MMKSLQRFRLPLLLLLTVILRFGVLFAFPSVFAWDQTGTVHGSDAYDIYARNLLSTGVYGYVPGVPDAQIPPLYAYLVAGVYRVFGRGYIQVACLHILLDVLTILLLYGISRHIIRPVARGETVGLLAGAMVAVYPYLIFQNLTLIDTPLFMTLLHAFLFLAILLRERERFDRMALILAVLDGLALGLAVLARPVIAPLALFVAVWFLFRRSFWQTALRLLPVAVVGVLVVTPWLVRDTQVYRGFVAVANNGGMNFWFGNSRYTIPFLRAGYHTQWATPDELVSGDDKEASAQLFAQSFQFLREHPEKVPELFWVKLLAYWSISVYPAKNPIAGQSIVIDENGNAIARLSSVSQNDPVDAYAQPLFDQIGRSVHTLYFGALVFLALIGIVQTRGQWREVSLLWFVQISMTIIYVIFIPATRYRVPTDPLLFIFSAFAALWSGERLFRQKRIVQPTQQPQPYRQTVE